MTLQILISTLGREGMARIAAARHPQIEGVGYLVAWQQPDEDIDVPEAIASRNDFKVVTHKSKGLSRNRNTAIKNAEAPLLLIADDDVSYTEEQIKKVIAAFEDNPRWEYVFFEYASDISHKFYPKERFEFPDIPKGYYPSSIEMAFRKRVFDDNNISFDENYGIGAPVFNCGEEEILLHTLLKKGVKGGFLPEVIAYHPGASTNISAAATPATVMTRGAITSLQHPLTWPLRMVVEMHKARKRGARFSMSRYIRLFLKGRKERINTEKDNKRYGMAETH